MMIVNRHLISFVGSVAMVTACIQPAQGSITFSGSSGSLSASAMFEIVGNYLQVDLTNTSPNDVLTPADVLTGVFFDLKGSPTLTTVSATVLSPNAVLFGGMDLGGVAGGEWAYKSSLAGTPGGATQGISSAGLGLFGPGDRFPGTNLQGPADPDGLQYGITSAGDNTSSGNTPVTGANALIQNSVGFLLGSLPSDFTLGGISDVHFQYGTSLSEPSIEGDPPAVPEPGSLVVWTLLGAAATAAAYRKRKKRRRWSDANRQAIYKVIGGD